MGLHSTCSQRYRSAQPSPAQDQSRHQQLEPHQLTSHSMASSTAPTNSIGEGQPLHTPLGYPLEGNTPTTCSEPQTNRQTERAQPNGHKLATKCVAYVCWHVNQVSDTTVRRACCCPPVFSPSPARPPSLVNRTELFHRHMQGIIVRSSQARPFQARSVAHPSSGQASNRLAGCTGHRNVRSGQIRSDPVRSS